MSPVLLLGTSSCHHWPLQRSDLLCVYYLDLFLKASGVSWKLKKRCHLRGWRSVKAVALSNDLPAALPAGKEFGLGLQEAKQHHRPSHSQQRRGNKPDRPIFFLTSFSPSPFLSPTTCWMVLIWAAPGRQQELFQEVTSGQKPSNSEQAQKFEQENHLVLQQFISQSLQSYRISHVFDTSFPSAEGSKDIREKKGKK